MARRPRAAGPHRSGARALGAAALGALALLGTGCASLDADWHLAPLYTQKNTFDGGTTTEVLGGAGLIVTPPEDAGRDGVGVRALRPLISETWVGGERRQIDWLVPLGRVSWRQDELQSYFFPFYVARSGTNAEGDEEFTVLVLPGFLWRRTAEGEDQFAWFPLFGHVENFLTFDDLRFVLFPLWMRTEREGNTTQHALFPVFAHTDPGATGDTRGWRFWPLYGEVHRENSYDRHFALWPVLNWQENHLERPEELREHQRSVFPLWTRTEVGSYHSTSLLWPLFGWAEDPRGDFWALDAPFPLVRFQRGGLNTRDTSRSRVWPLFSHLRADQMESHSILWPLVHWREETYRERSRTSGHVFPLWRSWTSTDTATGERVGSWRKFWPLWHRYEEGDRVETAWPSLSPFWRMDLIDFHWGWLWEVHRSLSDRTPDGPVRRSRGWLGLWWSEENAVESRASVSGLWSRRQVEGPEDYSETSLLFGLLRWRHDDGGVTLLAPALPGPGWPAMRRPTD